MRPLIGPAAARCSPAGGGRSRRARFGALLAVAAGLAVACGGEDTGPGPDRTGATDGPVGTDLTASWTGVTEDTVDLGLATIDFEALEDFGVEIDASPLEAMWRAWVDAQNERGGVNGRSIELTTAQFLPVGAETSDAACIELTEDAEVFLVAGQFFGDAPLCVTEAHATPYLGLFGLNDEREARSVAPFLALEMALPVQRGAATEWLVDEGILEGRRVGVHWQDADTPVADEVVLPLLEEAGVDVVATSVLEEFGTDTAAATEALALNVARLREAEVDVVVNVSPPLTLLPALREADFRPDLIFLNGQAVDPGTFEGAGTDPTLLDGSLAVVPDTPPPDELLADDLVLQCLAEYEAVDPDEPLRRESLTWRQATDLARHCATFRIFVLATEAAGASLTPDTLRDAAEALGPMELPGMTSASFGPGKLDAGNALRVYRWDTETSTMVPTGDPIIVEP